MKAILGIKKAKKILTSLGFSPKMLGYFYLIELFEIKMNNVEIFPLYKCGYEFLSCRHNKSTSSIDKAIQNAINRACNRTENTEFYRIFGSTIDDRRGKPTNKHLISTVIEKIM